jgi:hypothetical protein
VETEFANLAFANVSRDFTEMVANLKDVQKTVISMESAHRMENVFAMKISLDLIAERIVVQMIVVEMVYVIVQKNACVK